MPNLVAMTAANGQRWQNARITRSAAVANVCPRLYAAKNRYLAVAAQTGVPWFVIAAIHERESSQSWLGSLAQGDPWNRVSVHVPAGRGPFASWEAAAIDALVRCGPYLARWKDWSVAGALTALEQYNGVGYASRGVPSPYVWAGTNQYSAGKYVRDGVYDPSKVDPQLGCAAIIMGLMQLDSSIAFGAVPRGQVAGTGAPVVPHPGALPPSITNPAPGSIGAWLVSFFSSLFTGGKK
jgi:lysozyme family protein